VKKKKKNLSLCLCMLFICCIFAACFIFI